jgi:hypothetical protein
MENREWAAMRHRIRPPAPPRYPIHYSNLAPAGGCDQSRQLSRDQRAQISVDDLSGRRRAVLADRVFAAGDHALGWNGRNDQGGSVSSGVYLILLRTETDEQIEKVILVR